MAIWLTPTGVCTTKVGMPVSWQMGPCVLLRHIDIRGDDVQRLRGLRAGRFVANSDAHGLPHVGRQVGGGLGDQFNEAFFEKLHVSFDFKTTWPGNSRWPEPL